MESVPSILPETQQDGKTATQQSGTAEAPDACGIVPYHQPPGRAVTFRLSDDLYYRLKVRAAIERRSMRQMGTDALEVYLAAPPANQ